MSTGAERGKRPYPYSEDVSDVTGQVVGVNGGMYI
jgi:hypothetical protein